MISVHASHTIDRLLTGEDVPFGGKIFLLGGDFQVLPVIPHGVRKAIVENCLKRSPWWSHFKVIKLTKNMRVFLCLLFNLFQSPAYLKLVGSYAT